MAGSRVDPLEKDIDLLIRQDLSPEAQSRVLAEFAREALAEAEETNEAALGHPSTYETFVDGARGRSEDAVRPDGTIVYEFNLFEGLFEWVGEQLVRHSPVGGGTDKHPGLFAKSFMFFADGEEVDPTGVIPAAQEYVFINAQPYSRKIERGESDQSPDGVFETVAALAQRRFGNFAKVVFSFRSPLNGAQSNISRIGPLQDKRDEHGRFAAGHRHREGNAAERAQRQPAIIIYPR